MTKEKTLKKVIEKAVKGGWDRWSGKSKDIPFPMSVKNINNIIFSHDFAKAFWKVPNDCPCFVKDGKPHNHYPTKWKEELQQLVLEKDRLQYLKQFL